MSAVRIGPGAPLISNRQLSAVGFFFLQRVSVGFSVWAYEIAQNSAVLADLAGDQLAFNQDNQTAKGILPDAQVVSLLDMHLYA